MILFQLIFLFSNLALASGPVECKNINFNDEWRISIGDVKKQMPLGGKIFYSAKLELGDDGNINGQAEYKVAGVDLVSKSTTGIKLGKTEDPCVYSMAWEQFPGIKYLKVYAFSQDEAQTMFHLVSCLDEGCKELDSFAFSFVAYHIFGSGTKQPAEKGAIPIINDSRRQVPKNVPVNNIKPSNSSVKKD